MSTRPCLLATATLAALTATGCGETTIDAGKGEALIRKAVVEQVGAKVKSVECPEDRKGKAGDVFNCTVTGSDKTTGDVRVRQKDDKGNVSINAPFLHVREAETAIVSGIKQQIDVVAKVACPEIVPASKGKVIMCKATAQGQTRPVQVTLTDDKGHFDYKLV